MTREILIHHQIAPGAGDALNRAFWHAFDDRFIALHPSVPHQRAIADGPQLRNFLRIHTEAVGVTGNDLKTRFFSEYEGPEYNAEFCFHHAVLLSHPLARIAALYQHYRSGFGDDIKQLVLARRLPIRDWVAGLLQDAPHFVNDVQVGLLAKYGKRDGPPARRDLKIAERRLSDFSVIGTSERFEETLVIAEADLRPTFGSVDLACGEPDDRATADLDEALGSELLEQLRSMNRLDEELWKLVNDELDRRRSYIADISERMKAFAERNIKSRAIAKRIADEARVAN